MDPPPIQSLADAISTDKARRARAAPLSQKMGWGPELFEEACERMAMGIRSQFPEADSVAVTKELWRRLNRLRQVHEHGICQQSAPAEP